MRPTILVRMIIGYLAIFIPVVAVSVYAIMQLALFHRITGDILRIDNRMREYGPVENGVSVSVADTGPGIPKEDLNAIFDKFQQATMTSSNKIKGTGLGLAIVKHIIHAHGGKVWAESEPGHGSIFVFLLPA